VTAQTLETRLGEESRELYVAKEICGLHVCAGRNRHLIGPERGITPAATGKLPESKHTEFSPTCTGIRTAATACVASRTAVTTQAFASSGSVSGSAKFG